MISIVARLPKALLKGLAVIAIIASLQLLALIAVVIPIVGIVGLLAVLPVYLVCPIMLLEPNNSWIGAIRRAFSLGYKKWGTLILIMAVMGVVAILFSNAATFPLAMLTYVESLLEEPVHHSVFWSFVGDIAFYVLSVAGSFLLFMEVGLLFHAVTCHYGSVAAEAEDIGLESEIDNFDQLR